MRSDVGDLAFRCSVMDDLWVAKGICSLSVGDYRFVGNRDCRCVQVYVK